MKHGLGEIPLGMREQIAAAIRQRAQRLALDLRSAVSDAAGIDPIEGAACADALLTLLTRVVEDGTLDAPAIEPPDVAQFPPGVSIRQVVKVADRVERGLLDELALHDRLGATSEPWPLVAHSVRSSVLEVIAWFAEREAARAAFRDPLTTLLSAALFDVTLNQEVMRAIRHRHGIAVLLFDVDDLSRLNRVHGWGAGDRLLERLGGFTPAVRRLVLSHHERLDGSGYPHGLRETQLDLETRILAVCDVYDALISTRVYREAWTHERASQLLREGSGRLFDGRCVEALTRVVERRRGIGLAIAS
jgi:hypothetical protein